MQHTYSFFTNEQECIRAILDLHNGGKEIDLDPMYNKGMFYKALIKKPPLRYDINAESKTMTQYKAMPLHCHCRTIP